MTDALDGFTATDFTHDGLSYPVFTAGTGPAVIVIHEVPGLHPGVIDFGRRVVARGFHVSSRSYDFGEKNARIDPCPATWTTFFAVDFWVNLPAGLGLLPVLFFAEDFADVGVPS